MTDEKVMSLMAIKDVFKISRKTFFNPRGWLGYDLLKANTKIAWSIISDQFVPAKSLRTETFEQAVERQKLTTEDLQKLAANYLYYAIVFVVLGLAVIGLGFYLLFSHGSFVDLVLALASSSLFFVNAFRYDFWRFQIKQRKLGCTVAEWWHGKPNDKSEGA